MIGKIEVVHASTMKKSDSLPAFFAPIIDHDLIPTKVSERSISP